MVTDDNHRCPFCGEEISSGDKSCKNCGKSLRKENGNGARKGLGRALSKKYRDRIQEAKKRKKEEIVTKEAREIAIGLFSLIPNIGKTRAEAFWNAGFRTLEDLRKASIEEISQVEGIGRKLAEKIHESLPKPEITAKEGEMILCRSCGALLSSTATECGLCGTKVEKKVPEEKKEAEAYVCTECGSFINIEDEKCEFCGAQIVKEKEVREEIVPPEKVPEPEMPEIFICPECGAFLNVGDEKCKSCGTIFAPEMEVEIPEVPEPEKIPEPEYKEEVPELFICPECGAFLSIGAEECGNCGVVFEPELEEEVVEPEPEKVPEPEIEEEKHELFICPGCGGFYSKGAEECATCGITLPPEIEVEVSERLEPEYEEEKPSVLLLCPDCGAFIKPEATHCSICGSSIREELVVEEELRRKEIAPEEEIEALGVEEEFRKEIPSEEEIEALVVEEELRRKELPLEEELEAEIKS